MTLLPVLVDPRQRAKHLSRIPIGTARSRYLGTRLRAQRETAGQTARSLATVLGWSLGTLHRLESGESAVAEADLRDHLDVCGTDQQIRTELLELARQREDPPWVVPHTRCDPDTVPGLTQQFDVARRVTCYHPGAIPLLLCTPGFVRVRAQRQGASARLLAEHLALIARHNLLDQRQERRWVFYLDEDTLRSIPNIARRQWAHLAKLAASDTVSIRIIPTAEDTELPEDRFWEFEPSHSLSSECHQTAERSVFREFGDDYVYRGRLQRQIDALALSDHDSTNLIHQLAQPARRTA